MSSISGLNVLLTALRANQQGLFMTSHNVANASTEGFSRQTANMEALPPVGGFLPEQQLGQGVVMGNLNRIRNAFFDQQFRAESQSLGYYSARHDALNQLQAVTGEPSDTGIRETLQRFWSAWGDLANQPDGLATRAAVREAANAVADSFRHQAAQLTDLRTSLDQTIATRAQEINSLADQLATVNRQVVAAIGTGSNPNDLMDKRDLLLDHLSRLARVQVLPQNNGSLAVVVGGGLLVDSFASHHILPTPGAGGTTDLKWDYDGSDVNITGGEVAGLISARDDLVPQYQTQLDTMVTALVQAVNTQHAAGTGLNGATGLDFFTAGSTVSTVTIDAAIAADLNNIAAAQSMAPGDGTNAQAMSNLQRQALLAGGTIEDYYRGMVSTVGVQAQVADRGKSTETVLTQALENMRQSTSGVSLDEEMTNMIKYQKGYEAAARVLTVLDGMLDTLINRTGLR